MKRMWALTIALLALSAGVATAGSVGVGVFAGQSIPVLQDDAGDGTMFGVRVPIHLVPLLAIEPFYASTSLGDKTTTLAGVSYTRSGFDEKEYGANVLLSMGGPVQFFPFAGIGQTELKRPGNDLKLRTYDFGLGFGVSPMPKLSIQLRGELQAVVDGDTSRKFGNATLGASYALFSMP